MKVVEPNSGKCLLDDFRTNVDTNQREFVNVAFLFNFFGRRIAHGRWVRSKATDSPAEPDNPSTVNMDDVRRDTANALETTSAYSQQNKEKLVNKLKDQLANMDTKIEKLRVRGEGLASDAKTKWDLKMLDLEVKRKSANAKLNEIKNSTADAWGHVEKGAQSAWEELERAFQDASSDF